MRLGLSPLQYVEHTYASTPQTSSVSLSGTSDAPTTEAAPRRGGTLASLTTISMEQLGDDPFSWYSPDEHDFTLDSPGASSSASDSSLDTLFGSGLNNGLRVASPNTPPCSPINPPSATKHAPTISTTAPGRRRKAPPRRRISSTDASSPATLRRAGGKEGARAAQTALRGRRTLAHSPTSSCSGEEEEGPREGEKRSNKRFGKEAVAALKAWLFGNVANPYPGEEEKGRLAIETSLTLSQINYWFINARRRLLTP